MKIKKEHYGTTSEGEKVTLYILTNSKGISLEIITYGGVITKLFFPDNSLISQNFFSL